MILLHMQKYPGSYIWNYWHFQHKGRDGIAATCHDEEIALWPNVDGIEPHKTFTREDLTVSMRRKTTEWCYLIGTHFKTDSEQLMIISGSSCPEKACLRVSTIKKNRLKSYADLKLDKKSTVGHSMVRSSLLDSFSNAFYTGNENGDLCVWMPSS